ncbi:hypothetical protein EK21DRAFT_84938 [Setomelanomma holmii]|uniref:Uncharacterized protein n=1 Tax=Setomelanomma holmii TaxID=210430 RepID=A0A9P4LTJ8_9PLEO|nr:hypothetical protein EK21DRAFT_84938 [Setomelanomma holmii]
MVEEDQNVQCCDASSPTTPHFPTPHPRTFDLHVHFLPHSMLHAFDQAEVDQSKTRPIQALDVKLRGSPLRRWGSSTELSPAGKSGVSAMPIRSPPAVHRTDRLATLVDGGLYTLPAPERGRAHIKSAWSCRRNELVASEPLSSMHPSVVRNILTTSVASTQFITNLHRSSTHLRIASASQSTNMTTPDSAGPTPP